MVCQDVFADHQFTIVNNTDEAVSITDQKGRCADFIYSPIILVTVAPHGGRQTFSWNDRNTVPFVAEGCGHTIEWYTFKVNSIYPTLYLGMTMRPVSCTTFSCKNYYTGLFYASYIGDPPPVATFWDTQPLPKNYTDGERPNYINASCNNHTSGCMGAFSQMVTGNVKNQPFSAEGDPNMTFTINAPPTNVKISIPADNAHYTDKPDENITVSGIAEPGNNIEYGYGNSAVSEAKVGTDGRWSGSIPVRYLLMPDGATADVRIYARYTKDVPYATVLDEKHIAVARSVSITDNGLDSHGHIPDKWTVKGTGSTGGSAEYRLCEGSTTNCPSVALPARNALSWSISVPTPALSGSYHFSVTQHLAGFPDSTDSFNATKITPLSVDTPREGADYLESSSLTPSGKGTSGSTINYSIDGTTFPVVTVEKDQWQGKTSSHPAGQHTLIVTETRSDGSKEQVTRHFSVDAPVVIDSPENKQWIPPGDTLTVIGTATPSATVVCQLDVKDWFGNPTTYSTTVSSSARFSCPFSIKGVTGKHTVTVTEKVNGQQAGHAERIFILATPVTITSTDWNDEKGMMTAQGQKDAGTTLWYMLDGGSPSDKFPNTRQTQWHIDLPALAYGKHTLSVYQTITGETSPLVSTGFNVVVPVSITSPAEGGSVQEYTRFTIRGTGEPGYTIKMMIDGFAPLTPVIVDGAGEWYAYGPVSGAGGYAVSATESKGGETVNTVCRDVVVVNQYSHEKDGSVVLCSDNTKNIRVVK
ncbi:hypothetical protein [Photorhabdus luminescens]|uniref:hypothetical protein n=1 Tax=Photorhabdus luminescens TaxID=29488 RepID=UPI002240A06C|nr:hypothetical protein [Photorhabdus luminescens]MCW7761508.1 hypothetical protein [Photorhabdus luminescens subsp. venezuelensis]